MIHRIDFAVMDFARSRVFYISALKPLGLTLVIDKWNGREFAGFGSPLNVIKVEYETVARFRNESADEMRLCLEMTGAEVVMRPGHVIDLLASPGEELFPITIDRVKGGLQIHPHKQFDPDWHVRFAGKLIRVGFPTILSEHE